MKVKLTSFGFKYGRPECNHFIDVSWIVNPWRNKDKNAKDLVLKYDGVESMINIIVDYILHIADRDRCIFGVGCSSGRDRSVIIVERIKDLLEKEGVEVEVNHRDRER